MEINLGTTQTRVSVITFYFQFGNNKRSYVNQLYLHYDEHFGV